MSIQAPARPLRIVIASSEAVPFSKTGGLADVSGALAKALDALGHDVVLILPDYTVLRQNNRSLPPIYETGLKVTIPMNGRPMTCTISWTTLPGSQARVLLVRQPEYFDRRHLYQEQGHGYIDNCERFCFFSRVIPELCRQMVLRPDIVHCNDWQTGLIPALIHSQYAPIHGFQSTATVMTLHNMAYQGRFWHFDMPLTGMDWRYFNYHHLETWGDLNLLKTGIAFADQVTTVSPTYAREICTPEGGYGLDGLLSHRTSDLTGILNGIDDDTWNPASDSFLPERYNASTWQQGKATCKDHLQKRLKLPHRPDIPVLGMVSRMADQKGFDLVMASAERLLSQDLQMVFLGTGDPHYEVQLRELAHRYPDKVAAEIGFDESLAHQIEAGSDIFLMPSRFEPCGLNQMYSLKYGTVPVVRKVGGLADSVIDLNGDSDSLKSATGFVFSEYSREQFANTVERAIRTYSDKTTWHQLIANGMSSDFSWTRSAARYVEIYHKAISRVASRRIENRQ